MSATSAPMCPICATVSGFGLLYRLLDRVPYSVLAIPLRVAVATVFWNSTTTKLADWNATLALFTDEYQLPLLPPEFAANLALGIELTTPVLLVLGLLTRTAALVLLGMTAIIEIFVYPQAWPTHIQWAAMLLVLLCRGAGALSLDHLASSKLGMFGQIGRRQSSAT
jgi:putative oxidoreductase